MRIADLYARERPVFSFEFFPPKTEAGYRSLYRTIGELKRLDPGFVSVTCGAAGSTRRKTADLVIRIQRDLGITAMAHMVCTGTTREELLETLGELAREGIENVLTLRGDPPRDQAEWRPVPNGFRHADELAGFVKQHFDFCLGGGCYPEKHHEAPDFETDLANLKRKVDAGVEFLITQLFFDNGDFFDFVKRARAAGIEVPIVPGIMPIVDVKGIRRMTSLSGAKIPDELQAKLDEVQHDDALTRRVGVEWATMQCRELLEAGVPGIHFYTLNRSAATREIFQKLLER